MTWLQRLLSYLDWTITVTFAPPFPEALPAEPPWYAGTPDPAAYETTIKIGHREYKICPSCHGSDILAGWSMKRDKEEVWCDECGLTVEADDPYEAMRLWNDRSGQEK